MTTVDTSGQIRDQAGQFAGHLRSPSNVTLGLDDSHLIDIDQLPEPQRVWAEIGVTDIDTMIEFELLSHVTPERLQEYRRLLGVDASDEVDSDIAAVIECGLSEAGIKTYQRAGVIEPGQIVELYARGLNPSRVDELRKAGIVGFDPLSTAAATKRSITASSLAHARELGFGNPDDIVTAAARLAERTPAQVAGARGLGAGNPDDVADMCDLVFGRSSRYSTSTASDAIGNLQPGEALQLARLRRPDLVRSIVESGVTDYPTIARCTKSGYNPGGTDGRTLKAAGWTDSDVLETLESSAARATRTSTPGTPSPRMSANDIALLAHGQGVPQAVIHEAFDAHLHEHGNFIDPDQRLSVAARMDAAWRIENLTKAGSDAHEMVRIRSDAHDMLSGGATVGQTERVITHIRQRTEDSGRWTVDRGNAHLRVLTALRLGVNDHDTLIRSAEAGLTARR